MNGGAGNDVINLQGNSNVVQYASGNGNDTVYGFDENDILQITNGSFTSLVSGNDLILKVKKSSIVLKDIMSENVTVKGADDTLNVLKTINNLAVGKNNQELTGTSGRDSITSSESYRAVVIDAASGNDTIISASQKSSLNGGAGDDYISSSGFRSTLNGGKGDDTIENGGGSSVVIDAGAGNDTLSDYDTTDSFIDGGDGDDYFLFEADADVDADADEDYDTDPLPDGYVDGFFSEKSNNTVEGGEGNDTIRGFVANSVFNVGEGDDYVSVAGNNNTISVDEGKNIIRAYGNQTELNGGDDEDDIHFQGNDVLVSGGDGDDSIYAGGFGKNATIIGGGGNDVINLAKFEKNAVIEYSSGDGEDTIIGFSSDDTLYITGGEISKTSLNGDDFVISVGTENITLQGVAGSEVSLILADGTSTVLSAKEEPVWTVDGTTATYGTSTQTLVTLEGLSEDAVASDISLEDTTVTLAAHALGNGEVTISNGYTLALGDDVTVSETVAEGWSLSGTTATYNSASAVAGYSVSEDETVISYNEGIEAEKLIEISGLKKKLSAKNGKIKGLTL